MQKPILGKSILDVKSKNTKHLATITSAMEVLSISNVTFQKGIVVKESRKEKYARKLFYDAIEDLSFFFFQYLRLLETGAPQEKIEFTAERTAKLLESIEEDLNKSRAVLYEILKSDDDMILAAAVYILSSVEKDNETLDMMEEIINNREADFISLSRPLIREPSLIKDWQQDREKKAACISCNKCFEAVKEGIPLHCPVEKKLREKARG